MHKKTTIPITLLLLLTISTISASAITIPHSITITGTAGQHITKTINITNPLNQTVTITAYLTGINPDIIQYPKTITIDANTTKTITLNITMPSISQIGKIFFTTNNKIYDMDITIHPRKTQPITINVEQIIPSPPTSGKDFALIFNQQIDAKAILIIDEDIIPVDIQKGLAIIQTEKDQFGNATLIIPHITNSTFSYGFTINPWGTPYFIIPSDIELGDTKTITLKLDGTPLKIHRITITMPDGTTKQLTTDEKGQITLTFDKIGVYQLKTTYGYKTIYDSVEIGWAGRKEAYLHVYNIQNMETLNLKTGQRYKITITDKENNIIYDIQNLKISGPDGLTIIPLTAGTAWWQPKTPGFYTFFTSATDKYLSTTGTYQVEGTMGIPWILYLAIIIPVAAIILLYLYKKGKLTFHIMTHKKLEELDLL